MSRGQVAERGGETSVIPLPGVATDAKPSPERRQRPRLSFRAFAGRVALVGVVGYGVGVGLINHFTEALKEPTKQITELNKTAEELLQQAREIKKPVQSGADNLDSLEDTATQLQTQVQALADQFGVELPEGSTTTTTSPEQADQPG